jgi:hypothetical protein
MLKLMIDDNSFMTTIHPMELFDGCRIEGSVPNIATERMQGIIF